VARVKRPDLDRDGPIRSWTSAIGTNGAGRASAPDSASSSRHAAPDSDDPVARGVISGSRVVDQWIREAQQTARLLGGTALTDGWLDAGNRMMRTASDLMNAWWATMGVQTPNGHVGSANGAATDSTAAASGASSAAAQTPEPAAPPRASKPTEPRGPTGPRVKIEVASRRPVEVAIDIREVGSSALRVLDLRPEVDGPPRIDAPALEPWRVGGLRLRLSVPDEQPPGTYHAVVIDTSADCAVGTITVRVSA